MNVPKIQRLSRDHADLTRFYKVCGQNDVELSALLSDTSAPRIYLDCAATGLIISDVRVSILEELQKIEKAISKDISDGH